MVQLTDIYGMFRDSVLFYPKQTRAALRPETFRVLQQSYGREIEAANFGVVPNDKTLPFFYSRKWEEIGKPMDRVQWEYPLVTVYERPGHVQSPFFKPVKKYSLEISVLDLLRAENDPNAPIGSDAARPITLICQDTELILAGILEYIHACFITKTSADDTPRIYHKKQLETMVSRGEILPDYNQQSLPLERSASRSETEMFRAEIAASGIYGTGIVLEIPLVYCGPGISFDFEGTEAIQQPCANCE